MKKLHKHLLETTKWYRKWHNNPNHSACHWFATLVFIAIILVPILHGIAKTQISNTIAAQPLLKAKHSTGVIPDSPEKIKKIPRLIALSKEKKNNKAYINSITTPGESLIVTQALATLPAAVTLATPPIENQGGYGSCAAFAVSETRSIEEYYTKHEISYDKAINIFSPEYIYNQTNGGCGGSGGSAVSDNFDLVQQQGVSTWQSMPYSTADGCHGQPNAIQKSEASNFKSGAYSKVPVSDQTTIKNLLATNHPVVITVAIDSEFDNAGPGFVWNPVNYVPGISHSVILVGYDDAKHAYKLMNQWGTNWGDSGYIWVDYDFLPRASYYYVYTMNVASAADTTPPAVSLTTPVNGASVSGPITLSAAASDASGIGNVSFRIDGGPTINPALEDSTAPYSVSLNSSWLSSGIHTITAVARDTSGNITVSNPVTITVTNGDSVAPNTTLTSTPSDGSTFSGTATLSATANDNGGIAKVIFGAYSNGGVWNAYATDTEPPFTFPWDTIKYNERNDIYTWTAIAQDYAGNTVTSNPSTITLNNIFIHIVGSNIQAQNITDTSGTIVWDTDVPGDSQVIYGTTQSYGSATPLDPTLNTHHAVTISGLQPGVRYYYKVISHSSAGNSVESFDGIAFTTLTNNSDTIAPTTSLTAPASGATLSGTVTISATATDNIGVSKVEFYEGSILIGTDTNTPYSINWNTGAVTNGAYALSTKAYDSAGNIGTSSGVNITVSNTQQVKDTTPPTVSITSPANGTTVAANTTITISATATDNVGVTKVQLYVGKSLLCSVSSPLFSCTWKAPKGSGKQYSITAKAYDAANNIGTSPAVTITVK